MQSKYCSRCGQTRPCDNFHKNRCSKDGLADWCKMCKSEWSSVYNRETRVSRRKSLREWRRLHKGHGVKTAAYQASPVGRLWQKNYKASNKEKCRAQNTIQRARRNGLIVPAACKLCGMEDTIAHHPDYSKPFDVSWLCPACHSFVHRVLRAIEAPLQELDEIEGEK